MTKPTIRKVKKNGEWIWEVECGGIVRQHKQDWQAQWLYSYLMRLYNSDETNPQN